MCTVPWISGAAEAGLHRQKSAGLAGKIHDTRYSGVKHRVVAAREVPEDNGTLLLRQGCSGSSCTRRHGRRHIPLRWTAVEPDAGTARCVEPGERLRLAPVCGKASCRGGYGVS